MVEVVQVAALEVVAAVQGVAIVVVVQVKAAIHHHTVTAALHPVRAPAIRIVILPANHTHQLLFLLIIVPLTITIVIPTMV